MRTVRCKDFGRLRDPRRAMSRRPTSRLYERVHTDLARQIAAGELEVGGRLPSERELAQRYGISRPTVREAILALEVDGLVEVRKSLGVFVVRPGAEIKVEVDVGPFELLEARRAFEAEACALAAVRITPEGLATLSELLAEMKAADRNIVLAEAIDRRFHLKIAECTQNSAMFLAIEAMWDTRLRSPQYQLMSSKKHIAGITPSIEEHDAIIRALAERDPAAARAAMRQHLDRVLQSFMDVTETFELEQARARFAAQRQRFEAV